MSHRAGRRFGNPEGGGGTNCNVVGISLPWNKVKVKKIYEDSLDSMPSVKIQIMGGKVYLIDVIRQNIAGFCQQTFESKKFVLPYYLK